MAEVGMSEFQFGFGFLYEQTQRHWPNLRIAPVLPSLQREQQLGWDAHLPVRATDYYYQFKLTDYLVRSNATYIKDTPTTNLIFVWRFIDVIRIGSTNA